MLTALIGWYEQEQRNCDKTYLLRSSTKSNFLLSIEPLKTEKRLLGVDYMFCVILIEILHQLHFHPVSCDEQVAYIVAMAFKKIRYRDP